MAENREDAKRVGLEINMKDVNEENMSMCLKARGYMIMLTILSDGYLRAI